MQASSCEISPSTTTSKRRPGRPYGQKYGRAIRVRLPVEAETALDEARSLYGVTASEVVRQSVLDALPTLVARCVVLARNQKRSPGKRRRAIALIDQCAKATIALSPDGAKKLAPLREHNEAEKRKKAAERETARAERKQRAKTLVFASVLSGSPRRPSFLED